MVGPLRGAQPLQPPVVFRVVGHDDSLGVVLGKEHLFDFGIAVLILKAHQDGGVRAKDVRKQPHSPF